MKKLILIASVLGIYTWMQRKNNSPKVFYFKSLPFGFNGFIVPPFGIFIKSDHKDSKSLLLHELVHWKQFQREGLFKFLHNYNKANSKFG